jgi:ribonuclease P/MRP protein subunit RPP1
MNQTVILTQTNFSKLKDEIKKNKDKTLIFSGNDDELNRKVLEKLPVQILLINLARRKDRMKQRDSGFNQVMAKLAKKNNIIIGINLDEIIESEKRQKAEILARIRQNIKLCNKNKVKMKFISIKEKKDFYDLKALGLILGMPTWMIKDVI